MTFIMHDDLDWLFRPKFLKWVAAGAVFSALLMYLATSPLFVKPLYRSEALIFVPLTLFSQQFDQQGIGFGSEAEIDGHIQILQSTILFDSLEARFGLAGIYDIDTGQTGGRQRLYQRIRSRIQVEKTRYNSVSVQVRDRDAQRAADMANAIVALGDIIKEDLLRDNRLAAYRFARDLYLDKKTELDALEARMSLQPLPAPDPEGPGWSEQVRDRQVYETLLWELAERRKRYETLKKSLDASLPGTYVISPAVASSSPHWPPRLLLSLAASLVFVMIMLVVEMIRKDAVKQ